MPLSNSARNAVYNAIFRATNLTAPATVYLCLYETDPTAADVGTECSYTGYARRAITMGAPTNGSGANSGSVTFPACAGAVDAPFLAIRDASSGGTLWAYGPNTGVTSFADGETPRAAIGAISELVT